MADLPARIPPFICNFTPLLFTPPSLHCMYIFIYIYTRCVHIVSTLKPEFHAIGKFNMVTVWNPKTLFAVILPRLVPPILSTSRQSLYLNIITPARSRPGHTVPFSLWYNIFFFRRRTHIYIFTIYTYTHTRARAREARRVISGFYFLIRVYIYIYTRQNENLMRTEYACTARIVE